MRVLGRLIFLLGLLLGTWHMVTEGSLIGESFAIMVFGGMILLAAGRSKEKTCTLQELLFVIVLVCLVSIVLVPKFIG